MPKIPELQELVGGLQKAGTERVALWTKVPVRAAGNPPAGTDSFGFLQALQRAQMQQDMHRYAQYQQGPMRGMFGPG